MKFKLFKYIKSNLNNQIFTSDKFIEIDKTKNFLQLDIKINATIITSFFKNVVKI